MNGISFIVKQMTSPNVYRMPRSRTTNLQLMLASEKTEILKAAESGVPANQLAKEYDVSAFTMRQFLKKAGMPAKTYKARANNKRRGEAVNEIKAGLSQEKAAEKYNVSRQTIGLWVKKDKEGELCN